MVKNAEVLCVGISCVDVLIKNVDLLTPFIQETKAAEKVTISVGGDAANEAVILSRLGHRVQIMTGTADDGLGQFIRAYLGQNGVDISLSKTADEGESAVNVIVVRENGERNFINAGIPKAICFRPNIELIKDVKAVSIASLFLPPFSDRKHVLETARKAKEIGAVTCMDVIVNEQADLKEYKEALPYIDYIFPNLEEAAFLTGKTELNEMADVLLNYGIQNVIIKTGKEGCFVKNRKECFLVPGYRVSHVADTTGAGDNFAAGFISGLLQEKTLWEACRYACGIAAVSIQTQGGCTGVQSRIQAETLMKQIE